VAEQRLSKLRGWWSWLFERGLLDDNVLVCFRKIADVLVKAPIVLAFNLQRAIASYLKKAGPRAAMSRTRVALCDFNIFLNRRGGLIQAAVVDEALVTEWLRDLSMSKGISAAASAALHASPFLDFIVEMHLVPKNPLAALWARNRGRRPAQVVKTLLAANVQPGASFPAPQRFISSFGRRLEQFIELKRAMGRKYRGTEQELRRFDRFVANRWPSTTLPLSRDVVKEWSVAGEDLRPGTRKRRMSVVRQFALYLLRFDSATHVPDRSYLPSWLPKFRAHIYSEDQYRALLRAALKLPSCPCSLRPAAFHALLLVLYATGIRSGEASRLMLRDVDLTERTLLVVETKFFKSRIVPFSAELAEHLERYLQVRNRIASTSPLSPFFVDSSGRGFRVGTIAHIFGRLLVASGVVRADSPRRPRVHDIRHTFARTRVLKWYQDGADVTAKLPLLATYLGHVGVLSTQTYLASTPEILGEANDRFERAYGGIVVEDSEVTREYK
jgi:site-specific recombinase XerD